MLLALFTWPMYGQDSSRYFLRHYNAENGLPQNSIKGMQLDSKGYLWLLTESGLLRFDGQNFHTYDKLRDGSRFRQRPSSLGQLNNDTIIMYRGKDRHYRPAGYDSLLPYPAAPDRAPHLSQETIYNACYQLVRDRKQPDWITPHWQDNLLRSAKSYASIGNYYYWLNRHHELVVCDTALHHFQRITLTGLPPLTDSQSVARIIWDTKKLYLQWGNHIGSITLEGGQPQTTVRDIKYIGRLGMVTVIQETPNPHIFFIGTLTDGFYQFSRKEFTTKLFPGTPNNVFYAQAPIGSHDVVTEKGILTIHQPPAFGNFRSRTILHLQNGGYILTKWYDRPRNGLIFFDSNFRQNGFLPHPRLSTTCLFQSSDGRIWVGTEDQFLGELKDSAISWKPAPSPQEHIAVQAMQEITPQLFWLAGHEGLARYDVASNRIGPIPALRNKGIRTIYLDSTGILWIGTYGNGFYALKNDRLTKFPTDPSGFMEGVHAFMQDDHGYTWMSTNKGLFQARTQDLRAYMSGSQQDIYYHYYNTDNGFLTNEFNGGCFPAAIRTNSGIFSFPSMRGVVQFDPLSIKPILSANQLHIDQVLADSTVLLLDGKSMEIPSGTHLLQFAVSSPFYGNHHNHVIEYRMAGMDNSWRRLPADGLLSFERMSAGKYSLQFRKRTGFGNNVTMAIQEFIVRPAFYETRWFVALLTLAVLMLLWSIVRYRFRFMNRQQKRLEGEVAFRTREQLKLISQLESTVQSLELSKNELAHYSRLLEMLSMTITHDLQSPLRFFADVSATLHDQSLRSSDQPAAELSGELLKTSRTVHRFLQEFGYWIKSLNKDFSVQQQEVLLSSLFNDVNEFVAEQLRSKGNTLQIVSAPAVSIRSDRQLLLIILRNLVDNANKHTRQGIITLQVATNGDTASITVSDTGRGFNPIALAHVRKITQQSFNSLGTVKENSGYGYYFIGDFCKLLNIAITIDNRPTGGAIITLGNLPLVSVTQELPKSA